MDGHIQVQDKPTDKWHKIRSI